MWFNPFSWSAMHRAYGLGLYTLFVPEALALPVVLDDQCCYLILNLAFVSAARCTTVILHWIPTTRILASTTSLTPTIWQLRCQLLSSSMIHSPIAVQCISLHFWWCSYFGWRQLSYRVSHAFIACFSRIASASSLRAQHAVSSLDAVWTLLLFME